MEIPVLESELTALRLIKYSVDNDINLPINYCPYFYKKRLQGRGYRNRSANFVIEKFEEITGAGYIRRIYVKSNASNIKRLTKKFKKMADAKGSYEWVHEVGRGTYDWTGTGQRRYEKAIMDGELSEEGERISD